MSYTLTLLTHRKTYERLDVWPFILLYLLSIFLLYELDSIVTQLTLIFLLLMHALTYILGHWSPRCRALIQYRSALTPKNMNFTGITHVKVVYQKKDRSAVCEICELLMTNYGSEEIVYHFSFHFRKFVFDDKSNTFYRLKPTLKMPISEFLEKNEKNALFDANEMEITGKKFNELLKDQLMEPFTFFQFFSVALWLVDENRFFAIFTIIMLFFTACITVVQRLRTMIMYRQMRLNPQHITTYRENKWMKISSHDLEPGDVCIIQPSNMIKKADVKNEITDEQFLRQQIPYSQKLPPAFFKTENVNSESHKYLSCDLLLLSGGCVVNEAVLTGESIPQIKDSIERFQPFEILDVKSAHKSSVLFCGTEVLQTFPSESYPSYIKMAPPPNSCLAYVLRTGFDTSKGKLIRTVMFNTDNVLTRQTDAFIIIGILLFFSIISSVYILVHGLADPTRDRNKLFLRCILIITTVVPPELPMILTIAVNNSLMLLQKKKIFCTEPYRMPSAGKISVCAFDKTGTLTSDSMVFVGIREDLTQNGKLRDMNDGDFESEVVLAGCHSLIYVDKKLVGDPIETLFFQGSHWEYSSIDKTARKKKNEQSVRIRKIFCFRSDLKRMSTIINYERSSTCSLGRISQNRVLCKGAPEILQALLAEVPENYKETYEYYTRMGYRVLALAYRVLNENESWNEEDRTEIENNLIFTGFFICDSPLKRDSKAVIQKLQNANLRCIMITGDNHLTALKISRELSFGPPSSFYLIAKDNKFYWSDSDKTTFEAEIEKEKIKSLSSNHTLCIPGETISMLSTPSLLLLVNYVNIYARTSPSQKELLIHFLKMNGFDLLMCGDGTNDVGALKKADIGIALVGLKDGKDEKTKEEKKKEGKKKEEVARGAAKVNNMNADLFDMPQYKQGDACIAAPFTSKHSDSIRCVIIVLRQGICTLVTTMQTYKILTLSSLISAYSLSVLHFQSLKLSETQSFLIGISGAANYFFSSSPKPVKMISKHRPTKSIAEFSFIFSVVAQTALHLLTLHYVMQEVGVKYTPEKDLNINNDLEFIPTFLNTVVFLFTIVSQNCIFLFNHAGEPFMESLQKKPKYFKALIFPIVIGWVLMLNLNDEISKMLELTFDGIPVEATYKLAGITALVIFGNWGISLADKLLSYGKIYDYI